MRWDIQRARGNVRELQESSAAAITQVGGDPTDARRRSAIVQNGTNRALVLGSAQLDSTVDEEACATAGVEVVRRRSGGGAVLVDPSSLVWVDLVVAATDPLWSADVGRSMWWVGEAWAKALEGAGLGDLSVWKGPMLRSAWSSLVCFAGLGPGEVISSGRRKLVGIAQRRTRYGALFQCACVLRWDPEALLQLLVLPEDERQKASRELAGAALGVGVERAEAVVDGFLAALPS
jgi:lipoate---protein ligase